MIVFSLATILMNRPSSGTIIKPSLEDEPRSAEEASTNTITGKHFSLIYEAGLDTVSNISSGDHTALEVYRVARSDTTGRRTFVVTIKNLPDGGMSEESSYKLRHINPNEYFEGTKEVGGKSFVLFERSDKKELTAFTTNGGLLAMLAYSLDAPGGDLRSEAEVLLEKFNWLD